MYHHFRAKEALAQAAIDRSAADMRAQVLRDLASDGSAFARVQAYLGRERDVLKGCRFGRLVQDADVVESPTLRPMVEEMFGWVRAQLSSVIAAGVDSGEFRSDLDPVRTAAAITATLQGAYVLARAAQDTGAFDDAVEGVLALLAAARA